MKRLIKIAMFALCLCIGLSTLTACGNSEFDYSKTIMVITRDANSGTREAFTERVFPGNKTGDVTIASTAVVTESTATVLELVATMTYAVGYDSLGYVNSSVKMLKVNGVAPTNENIESGDYKLQRPFVITAGKAEADMSAAEKDFLRFIKSTQAKELIASEGYVNSAAFTAESYSAGNVGGTMKIWGSTSVTPLMNKLTEKYNTLNTTKITFTVGGSGSGDGQKIGNGTAGGTGFEDASFGMMSKSASELNQTWSLDIAIDGVAIIVNNSNPISDISLEQLAIIFGRNWKDSAGTKQDYSANAITKWSALLAEESN